MAILFAPFCLLMRKDHQNQHDHCQQDHRGRRAKRPIAGIAFELLFDQRSDHEILGPTQQVADLLGGAKNEPKDGTKTKMQPAMMPGLTLGKMMRRKITQRVA